MSKSARESVSKQRTSTHPGAILREDVLPELFAEKIGVDAEELKEILAERADVTPAIAEKLGAYLGNGADIWLALQRKHNEILDIARRASDTTLDDETRSILENRSTPIEPRTKVILYPIYITSLIAVRRVLHAYGVQPRDAHLAINQLAVGEKVTINVDAAYSAERLTRDLKTLGVDVQRAGNEQ